MFILSFFLFHPHSVFFFIWGYFQIVSYFVMDVVDETSMNASTIKVRRKPKREMKIETFGSGGVVYQSTVRGNRLLHYMGHKYIKNNVHGANVYWKCTKWHNGCKARAITNMTMADSCSVKNVHNHVELSAEFSWIASHRSFYFLSQLDFSQC